ncbi:DUF559 domain-containing protein [Nocardioides panacisoli]
MTKPPLPDHPFTFADVRPLGVTRADLDHLRETRHIVTLLRGVFVRADVEVTLAVRAAAAARVMRPHQIVCDRTAAWLHGIDVLTYGELGAVPDVEVCARRGHGPCLRGGVDGRTRDLADGDIMEVGGVRVTTPLRTALDLGCILERRDALAALDAFRRDHELTAPALTMASYRFRRRRGVVQLRELIPLADPRSESARESWTRLAIIDAGLPAPELQVWVTVDGVATYRLDLAYAHRRVAVEYDGYDAHERTPEQVAHDEERRAWLRAHGWTVIVVRRGDFTGAALDRWIHELREALASPYSNRRRLERGAKNRR